MKDMRDFIADLDYPCHRPDILRRASANGADDSVLGALGTLPEDREFGGIEEVDRALNEPLDPHRTAPGSWIAGQDSA